MMERQMIPETQEARRTIASYNTYAEAQRAVDYLSDQRFPVQRIAIVAEGIRLVEQVTGRLNYGRATLAGALSGATTGLFIGVLISLFTIGANVLSMGLLGLVIGAIIGAITGVIGYALTGGRRDFTSVSGIQAERYNVMADLDVANDAIRLLQNLPRT